MATRYKKATVSQGKGFGTQKVNPTPQELRRSVEEHGRALIGVTPDDKNDPRQVQWTYSVPNEDSTEPVLLTSYPSSNTTRWVLNYLGDHFREVGWEGLSEGDTTELTGFLGANGELPLRVRLLTDTETEASRQHYTCLADHRLPIVLVTLPDPAGHYPEEAECSPVVSYSEIELLEGLLNHEVSK